MKAIAYPLSALLASCALAFAEAPEAEHPLLWKPSPPVEIEGVDAVDLTDDQLRQFLQRKIQSIDHFQGNVELVRLAPGYAVTLIFDRPLEAIVLGDPSLVAYKQHDRLLVLSAAQRQGDTSLQLLFKGGILLNYHVFIAPNYVNAQSTLHVRVAPDEHSAGQGFREISALLRNFDLWKQEGTLPDSRISRLPVMRRGGDFEYYDFYRFADGSAALTFAFRNPDGKPRRLHPGRLRFKVGGALYTPLYTSLHRNELSARQATTGFVFFQKPPFVLEQPFELIWR